MRINITGHHVEVTEGLRSAVDNSFNKLMNHYPDIDRVEVVLTVEKNEQLAEGIVHFLGQDLVAKSRSGDLYISINDLRSKMESLLQKRKATVKSHSNKKGGGASFSVDTEVA